ncbi:hypothetical protein OCU04_001591 [Sclerotinia nivalis]|uniref:Uncharacterized protein n=1 Tax=Sclerotinia nivalis TaxID=352851 RepID=A0A9X0AYF1_9HELO|nr:hypothetical protein OCU04_001591 [Sclerotinia nivalis]
MPLGGIKNHGQYQSRVPLGKKYLSVQASINPTMSKYRRAGQVTGLLFRSNNDPSHPDLLGQWTGAGTTYNLEEGEQIVDLEVTTVKPICKQMSRSCLSQVEGITIMTNRRMIKWGPSMWEGCEQELQGVYHYKSVMAEAIWEFNAMFDRVLCVHQ